MALAFYSLILGVIAYLLVDAWVAVRERKRMPNDLTLPIFNPLFPPPSQVKPPDLKSLDLARPDHATIRPFHPQPSLGSDLGPESDPAGTAEQHAQSSKQIANNISKNIAKQPANREATALTVVRTQNTSK